MFWLVLLCGWALTAATIALVWSSSRPKRTMTGGLVLGALTGLVWPISFWVAIGALLGRFAARRSGAAPPSSFDAPGHRDRVPPELIGRWRGTVEAPTKAVADVTIDQADLGESVGRLTVGVSDRQCEYTTSLLDAGATFVEFDLTLVETTESQYYCNASGTSRLDLVNGDGDRVEYSYQSSGSGFLDRYAS